VGPSTTGYLFKTKLALSHAWLRVQQQADGKMDRLLSHAVDELTSALEMDTVENMSGRMTPEEIIYISIFRLRLLVDHRLAEEAEWCDEESDRLLREYRGLQGVEKAMVHFKRAEALEFQQKFRDAMRHGMLALALILKLNSEDRHLRWPQEIWTGVNVMHERIRRDELPVRAIAALQTLAEATGIVKSSGNLPGETDDSDSDPNTLDFQKLIRSDMCRHGTLVYIGAADDRKIYHTDGRADHANRRAGFAEIEGLEESIKERLVSVMDGGERLVNDENYETVLASLLAHQIDVEELREHFMGVIAIGAAEIVDGLAFSLAQTMRHAVHVVRKDTAKNTIKGEKGASKGNVLTKFIDRPWCEMLEPMLDFCMYFYSTNFYGDEKRLELTIEAQIQSATMNLQAGRGATARNDLDDCIAACIEMQSVPLWQSVSTVQHLNVHLQRMQLVLANDPKVNDKDFKRCKVEFAVTLMRSKDAASDRSRMKQAFDSQIDTFTRVWESGYSDTKTLYQRVVDGSERRLQNMACAPMRKKMKAFIENFKHSSNAQKRLETQLGEIPKVLHPEACVWLAYRFIDHSENSQSGSRDMLSVSEFTVWLCDKALRTNDECWPAYWLKEKAMRICAKHDTDRRVPENEYHAEASTCLHTLVRLQPSLDDSEEFNKARIYHDYCVELHRAKQLGDTGEIDNIVEAVDSCTSLEQYAAYVDETVGLNLMRMRMLQTFLKRVSAGSDPRAAPWQELIPEHAERLYITCSLLLDALPKEDKKKRAHVLQTRCRSQLDYKILPMAIRLAKSITFQPFTSLLQDVNQVCHASTPTLSGRH
jgi:hypothetical protein